MINTAICYIKIVSSINWMLFEPSSIVPFISAVVIVDVPVAVMSVVVIPPLAVSSPVKVVAPVTPNVPPTFKFFATPTPPSTFKAPVVYLLIALCHQYQHLVTSRVLLAVNEVKAPLDAVDEPIAVPSIFPPFISAVEKVEVSDVTLISPPTVKSLSSSAIPLMVTLSSDLPRTI